MLDPKYIREHAEEVKENVRARRLEIDVDAFLQTDAERLALLKQAEDLRHERNIVAEQMKSVPSDERSALIERGKTLKERVSAIDGSLEACEAVWKDLLHRMPNSVHPDVPPGASDEENKEIKRWGTIARPAFPLKNHMELAEALDLIDFARGTKVAGSKWYFLKGKLVLLEQALIQYGLQFAVREGFLPMMTPDVAKEAVLLGKGFLPRGPEKQVYYVEGEDLALIGSSEITLLGYHMDEMLPAEEMPKKYTAFSHCYRTEAGSYGRESYGLYRVHQFSKVELFAFAMPKQSEAIHQEFLRIEEAFWQSLGIPYRVVDCCVGDLGAPDYRRYDIEAWMWGKNEGKGGWGEVTSTSQCGEYQSRGLHIKYEQDGEKEYVHTLNGTMVATPRTLICIMEHFQKEDGSISVPEVLQPFCGFDRIG